MKKTIDKINDEEMMKLGGKFKYLTSIYDCKAQMYVGINLEDTQELAKRNFQVAISNTASVLHYCKDDFELRTFGILDIESGLIQVFDMPVTIIRGVDVDYLKGSGEHAEI